MIIFGVIEIIELPIALGDNPTAIGAPIGVGWKPTQRFTVPVDVFERQKPRRRSNQQLRLSKMEREER
jgi:hypothetical protein